ncbi:hypothetical protein M441DRAFT_152338 [Trichoderma asperellum CBS 433.97]|uniref:Phospholipase/carboxylesterase/thioesterase domain-containing protein n=1 Tax=Trichoderma asperellum (strain ATCC 204424 / CBS 433.97 / NBRC 101777) TaxID=1042311 RepID=A0A2T3YTI8_TRIA4|nr:hypothetical protein M441DRAFT_152338 [Trichoderma asperellum CBS 433.97]PTB35839.1 hypothetical protein M441DRAFT_152338 [Trichoderma asperellum CBS 433.97]
MVADLPLSTIPPSKPHTHTIIFLHENKNFARSAVDRMHEATDRDWQSIIQNYASTRWVFPQAPTGEPLIPSLQSISTGIQHAMHRGEPNWWNQGAEDPDAARREAAILLDLRERIKELEKVIRNEVSMLGGRWDRVILAGIGHGAGMAMATIISLGIPSEDGTVSNAGGGKPQPLGAFVGISCEMPLQETPSAARRIFFPDSVLPENNDVWKKTPVLLQYFLNGGQQYLDKGKALRDMLVANGVEDVCWKEYEDGGMFMNSPRGVEDVKDFFRDKMGLRPNY